MSEDMLHDLQKVHPLEREIGSTTASIISRMCDELKCSICLYTVTEPHSTPCNHLFCSECIHRSIQMASNSDKCPLCKAPITRRSLTAMDDLSRLADACRELKDAYEEDTDMPLSQIPLTTTTHTHPLVQRSQTYPQPAHIPTNDTLPELNGTEPPPRRKKGRPRKSITDTPASHSKKRRDVSADSGEGPEIEIYEETLTTRKPKEKAKGKGRAKDTASDRTTMPMTLPGLHSSDTESILSDVIFPPLPDVSEMDRLFFDNDSATTEAAGYAMLLAIEEFLENGIERIRQEKDRLETGEQHEPCTARRSISPRVLQPQHENSGFTPRPNHQVATHSTPEIIAGIENRDVVPETVPNAAEVTGESASKRKRDDSSLNNKRTSRKNVVVTGSILKPRSDLDKLKTMVEQLGGRYEERFTEDVSHVVTYLEKNGTSRRTMKTMTGILKGCWIVGQKWIERCATEGFFVDEEEYEAVGDTNAFAANAPSRARHDIMEKKPPLFHQMQFVLYGEFTNPSREDLRTLLEMGGGTVTVTASRNTEPEPITQSRRSRGGSKETATTGTPAPARSVSPPLASCVPVNESGNNAVTVVISKRTLKEERQELRKVFRVRPVAEDWVLDSVSSFKVLAKKVYCENRIFEEAQFDARFTLS